MKRLFFVLALILMLMGSHAQDTPCGQWNPDRSQWYACPETPPTSASMAVPKQVRLRQSLGGDQQQVWDKNFTAYTIGLWAATIADIESTQSALSSCSGCREANPVFGPDPNRGRMWAVMAPANGLCMWLSYRWKAKGKRWWMLPMLVPTASHGSAAGLNLRF